MTTTPFHRDDNVVFTMRQTPDPLTGEQPNAITIRISTDGILDPAFIAERVRQCLNACAEIENPAAIPALVLAVKRMADTSLDDPYAADAWAELLTAMVDLDAPEPPCPVCGLPEIPRCCGNPMEDITGGHDHRHGSRTFACLDCRKRLTTQRP